MVSILDKNYAGKQFYEGVYKRTYGYSEQELLDLLLHKRVTAWNFRGTEREVLVLEDGTTVRIKCSDYDCCAVAGGKFENVVLDALITDVRVTKARLEVDDSNIENYKEITLFHNLNPIAVAETTANNGRSGYYYSVCSLVVDDVHYPVLSAERGG